MNVIEQKRGQRGNCDNVGASQSCLSEAQVPLLLNGGLVFVYTMLDGASRNMWQGWQLLMAAIGGLMDAFNLGQVSDRSNPPDIFLENFL